MKMQHFVPLQKQLLCILD